MRPARLLTVVALLVSGLVVGTTTDPADAAAHARARSFSQTFTCGEVDWDDGGSGVLLAVGAGHWTNNQGKTVSNCGYAGTHWHGSTGSYRATVRYVAGSKVVHKQSRVITNKTVPVENFWFYDGGYGSHGPFFGQGKGNRLTYGGKPFKVTVTFSKKGYHSKVLTRTSFPYNN